MITDNRGGPRRMFIRQVLLTVLVVASALSATGQDNLFQKVAPGKSKLQFKNILQETPKSNVLTYEYFFNGGGVATGDVNNDGLDDIYFTSNMGENKLYLNQGGMKFRDITSSAGVACPEGWKTGVCMADVNGDGLLDIYVSRSGKNPVDTRRNLLFINNGDLTFSEAAKAYGLDDPGYSTHATFFDFDNDGDLDMYLLNHNVVVIREFEYAKAKAARDPYSGDKLFRNDNGVFTDISEAAGIKGNPLGFGLGVSISDINQDGWLDIYVSNDYVEPDYLYINNGNGTFSDLLDRNLQHISYFSMGSDISDVNNDGLPDIYTVDMLPEDNRRQKLLYGPENYEHYALMVMNGFYFQNMRNMLHLNNGNSTFSEIGQFAGISNTDWSWAPLFADYDNDGWKDLFVSNGYFRDYTNRDFLKYKGDYYFKQLVAKEKADTFHLVSTMTSTPLRNYVFRNNGNLRFSDKSIEWGFKEKTFSSGAAFSDLDNDGDLDLVINNQNTHALLYQNTINEKSGDRYFLQMKLSRKGLNSGAFGTKVWLYQNGAPQFYEHNPIRGFQSSVSHRVHFGVSGDVIDSVILRTLYGEEERLYNVKANTTVDVSFGEKAIVEPYAEQSSRKVFTHVEPVLSFVHQEAGFNDFKRQPLLTTMLTTCGPVLAAGDLNGDRREDIFAGGTEGSPGKVFLQTSNGAFEVSTEFDKRYTDADALFFDADGDGDSDLYVVSGGYNDYKEGDAALQDRLYLNDGKGSFAVDTRELPANRVSKSCVAAGDFDHDGRVDLFVGGRVVPGQYPVTPESFLLHNTPSGFQNVTSGIASELAQIGMVTDAQWADVNADGWVDLVVVGEFMAVEVFLNENGKQLTRATDRLFEKPLKGMWSRLLVHDFDNDGDPDLLIGNFGLNSQLKADEREPVELVYKDFDANGSVDPFLTYYIQGTSYPFASRDELLDQIYAMRSRFTNYEAYSQTRISDIFPASELKTAGKLSLTRLESVYLSNESGSFVARSLPPEAQFAPVYAITLLDYNQDGNMDFLLGGNQSSIRIRMGVIDANFGQLFHGDGTGHFTYVEQNESGLALVGDVKALQMIQVMGEQYLLIGINNVGIDTYKLNRP